MNKFKKMSIPKRFVSLILTVMMIVSVLYIPAGIVKADAGDKWDLGNFQTELIIKDNSLGQIQLYPNPGTAPLIYGETYNIEVHFEAPQLIGGIMTRPEAKNGWLTYRLPPNIEILKGGAGNIFIAGNNEDAIGIYVIEKDKKTGEHLIRIQFGNVSVSGTKVTPSGRNLLEQSWSNLTFMVEFQGKFAKIEGPGTVTFGNDTTIAVTEPEKESSLITAKTQGAYNTTNRTIDYTMTFTAKDGEVVLTRLIDTPARFNSGVEATLEALYTGKALASFVTNINVKLDGAATSYTADWTADRKGFEIKLGVGVTIPKDKSLVVTYTFDFGKVIDYLRDITPALTYSYSFKNRVNAFGPDKSGKEVPKGEAAVTTTISSSFTEKKGEYFTTTVTTTDDTTEPPTNITTKITWVKWTMSAGDYRVNLNGFTFTDTLGAGMAANGTGTTVSIVLKNKNAEIIETYTQLTAVTPLGFVFTPNGFRFTIPSGGVNGGDVYRVEMTYTVQVNSGKTVDETVKNTIKVEKGTLTDSREGTVDIERGDAKVKKTGKIVVNDGDPKYPNGYIQWDITFFVPGSLEGEPVWFNDSNYWQEGPNRGCGYFSLTPKLTYEDFTVTCNNPSYTPVIGPYDPSGKPVVEGQNMTLILGRVNANTIGNSAVNNGWHLWFEVNSHANDSAEKKQASTSPFSIDTEITVSYKIPLDTAVSITLNSKKFTTLKEYLMDTGLNYLNSYYLHYVRNVAFIFYGESANKSSGVIGTQWPIYKFAEIYGDRIDYSVFVPIWYLNEDPNMEFVDTFDGNLLEYLPYSFRMIFHDNVNDRLGPYVPVLFNDLLATNEDPSKASLTHDSDGNTTIRVAVWQQRGYEGGSQGTYTGNKVTSPVGGLLPYPRTYDTSSYYRFRYSLKIKDGVELGEYKNIKNIALIGGFENECTVDIGKKPVTKTMFATGVGTAYADIVINPLGQKIVYPAGVKPPAVPLFRAEDRMSSNLSYVSGSLQFWTCKKPGDLFPGGNGTVLKPYYYGEPGSDSNPWVLAPTPTLATHTDEADALPWTYRVNNAQSIDFWFPDGAPVRATYRVRGTATDDDRFANMITVTSYGDVYVLEGFEVDISSAKANLNVLDLMVIKKDAKNTAKWLPGVELALYTSQPYGNFVSNLTTKDEDYPESFVINGTTFYYVEEGTTTNEGYLTFTKELYSQDRFKNADIIYAIYEKEAPAGYEALDSEDDHLTFFYFQIPSAAIRAKFKFYDSYGSVEIFNEPIEFIPTGKLKLTKKVEPDNPWKPDEEFAFKVTFSGDGNGFDNITNNGGFIKSNGGKTWEGTIKYDGYRDVTFDNIPLGAEYTITEEEIDGYVCVIRGDETRTITGTLGEILIEVEFINEPVDVDELLADVTIHVKKIVSGTGEIPACKFTFTLTEVDEDGEDVNPTVLPDPGYLEYELDIDATGSHSFTFEIENLAAGTYYFKVTETGGGEDENWTCVNDSYIVIVEVYDDGSYDVYYPQSNGEAEATSKNGPYTLKRTTLKYLDQQFRFTGINNADYIYGFCADKWLGQPNTAGRNFTHDDVVTRDNSHSALAFSLYNATAGAQLTQDDYYTLLGFTDGKAPFDNNQIYRRHMLSYFLVAYYEFRAIYPEPEYDWNPRDFSKWPEYLPETAEFAKRDYRPSLISELFENELKANGISLDAFAQAVEKIDAMMEYYRSDPDGTCITSIEMIYDPDSENENCGWLSFAYGGYIPPDHPLTLTWTANFGTVTIKDKNNNPIPSGSMVNIGDKFYVEHGGIGSVIFKLEDNLPSLMNGSIKGDLYRDLDYRDAYNNLNVKGGQRMLIGYSQFATMMCELEIGKGDRVTFINKYVKPEEPPVIEYGSLVITKDVIGGPWEDGEKFTFTVTFEKEGTDLSESGITAEFAEEIADGEITGGGDAWTIKLTKKNQSVLFTNIPAGTTFIITEADDVDDYTCVLIEVDGEEDGDTATGTISGDIVANAAIVVTYTNEYEEPEEPGDDEYGSLKLTKKIIPDNDWEDGEEFNFIVTFEKPGSDLSESGITAEFAEEEDDGVITGSGDAWTVKLTKKNQSVIFKNIPKGTLYTIVEDYDTDKFTCTPPDNANGKIGDPDLEIIVDYENERIPEPVLPGTLTLTKKVLDDEGEEADVWEDGEEFDFTVTLKVDSVNKPDKVEIDGEVDEVCVWTETPPAGSGKWVWTWSGTLTTSKKSIEFGNILIGADYTIVEDYDDEKYICKDGDGVVIADGTVSDILSSAEITVTYVNERIAPEIEPGSLTITKKMSLDSDVDPNALTRTYTIIVTFTKEAVDGVVKYSVNSGTEQTLSGTSATIELKAGDIAVFTDIPVGAEYEVTEPSMPTENHEKVSIDNGTGTIETGDNGTVTVTNRYTEPPAPEPGSLTITKSVTNTTTPDPNAGTQTFDIKVVFAGTDLEKIESSKTTFARDPSDPSGATWIGTLKAGESVIFTEITAGVTYAVTEENTGSLPETYAYGGMTDGGIGEVNEDSKTVTVNNTYTAPPAPGSLTVAKSVTGTGYDSTKEFEITVTFTGDMTGTKYTPVSGTEITMGAVDKIVTLTLKHGESVTFTNIPPAGVTYEVTEPDAPANYAYVDVTHSGSGTFKTIASGSNGIATVNNLYTKPEEPPTPKTADLEITVSKNVQGSPNIMPKFNFALRELNSAEADDFKSDGLNTSGSITYPDDYTFTIPGLETGKYYYQINETGTAGQYWTYDREPRIVTVTVDGESVSMAIKGEYENLTFTNKYYVPPTTPPPSGTDDSTDSTTATAAPETSGNTTTTATPAPTTTGAVSETETSTEPVIDTSETVETTEEPISETSAEPSTEPTIETTEAQTVLPTESWIEVATHTTETPEIPTTVITEESAEPAAEDEEYDDGRIPLNNGWFAIPLGDDLYEIIDQNGVPLGYVQLQPGESIEDWEDYDDLIPLWGLTPEETEPVKPIPKTGDNSVFVMIGLIILFSGVAAIMKVILKKRSFMKQ